MVVVAAAFAVAFEVAGVGEFGNDPLSGAFGDADGDGDVPKADFGVAGNA